MSYKTHCATKQAILADGHDVVLDVHEKVAGGFRRAVRKNDVPRNRAGGLLYTITQKATWKTVTPLAGRALRTAFDATPNRNLLEGLPDGEANAEEACLAREILLRYAKVIARLSHEEQTLVAAKTAFTPGSYAALAALWGTSQRNIKVKVSRLWRRIQREVLGEVPAPPPRRKRRNNSST